MSASSFYWNLPSLDRFIASSVLEHDTSRFASVAMDESHLISTVCAVSLNPVRARPVVRAEE
jgi:hypothetical protein